MCLAAMKNIFQFEKLYSNLICFAQDIKNYIVLLLRTVLGQKNLVLHYNVIMIKIFFLLTFLIKLGITGYEVLRTCKGVREKIIIIVRARDAIN